MGETRESAERVLQASAKFLQLGCLDTSPEGGPVCFYGTLLSSELNSVAVNIEKKLPMQMFGLPVKFLE
jgi:hypothetical protein